MLLGELDESLLFSFQENVSFFCLLLADRTTTNAVDKIKIKSNNFVKSEMEIEIVGKNKKIKFCPVIK
jgi:hypothetical protein